jgi:Right handed beta helix region
MKSRPWKLSWQLAVLAVVFSMLVITSGAAGADSGVSCGETVTTDTTLDSNLICDGPGLIVDGATLDLNGNVLSGSNTSFGVRLQGLNAAVVNGTIRHFDGGVQMNGSPSRVSNVTISDNVGAGVYGLGGRTFGNPVIQYSTITRNGSNGIFLAVVDNARIDSNVISNNGGSGIDADLYVDVARYTNNRITKNGKYGLFAFSSTSTAIGNTLSHNGLDGIHFVEGDAPFFAKGYTLTSNRADDNGGVGISACVQDSASGNSCAPGMIDGGGNVAKHNGGNAECVNVVCARNSGTVAP